MKLITLLALLALICGCGGDVTVEAVSSSVSRSESSSGATSGATSGASQEIQAVPCERCKENIDAAAAAERMLRAANEAISGLKSGDIVISIVNEIYTDAMAMLEDGDNIQSVEAAFSQELQELLEEKLSET